MSFHAQRGPGGRRPHARPPGEDRVCLIRLFADEARDFELLLVEDEVFFAGSSAADGGLHLGTGRVLVRA